MKIKIFGKEYDRPTLNFRACTELEELGFDFAKLDKKMFKSSAILLAFTTKTSVDEAMDLIDKNADEFNEVSQELFKLVVESDFFKRMATKK